MKVNEDCSLSIVVPVYNVSKYIITALNSVVNQTVQPFEVIVVNDGSTDNSAELIDKHFSHIPYFKIIHTINQGLGEARNVGLRQSSGQYVYFFDSDDLIKNDLVENFQSVLITKPEVEIYAFSAESFYDDVDNSVDLNQSLPRYRRNIESVFSSGRKAFNTLSKNDAFYPNAWLYIFKKSLHDTHNLEFKAIIHEDEEFTPRLFFAGELTIVTDKVFFHRRVRAGSIMQNRRTEKNIIGYIKSIEALESLLPSVKCNESRKNLNKRIVNNIVNIILIMKLNAISLSPETSKEYNEVLARHSGFLVRLANFNFFSYRLIRFLQRRIVKIKNLI